MGDSYRPQYRPLSSAVDSRIQSDQCCDRRPGERNAVLAPAVCTENQIREYWW